MVAILPENHQSSFAERFAKAFGNLGRSASEEIPRHFLEKEQSRMQEAQRQKENEVLSNLIGKDISGVMDPKMRQELLSMALQSENQASQHARELMGKKELLEQEIGSKREMESLKSGSESRQKLQPLQAGLQTIQEMRRIGQEGRLGRGSAIKGFLGGQTAKDRAKYAQLGKSIISLASNIPIRNQKEFEVLAHDLYDPSLPDDAREGILEAMEEIIMRSMKEQGLESEMPSREMKGGKRRSIGDIFG